VKNTTSITTSAILPRALPGSQFAANAYALSRIIDGDMMSVFRRRDWVKERYYYVNHFHNADVAKLLKSVTDALLDITNREANLENYLDNKRSCPSPSP
jgi:hypothetical protein